MYKGSSCASTPYCAPGSDIDRWHVKLGPSDRANLSGTQGSSQTSSNTSGNSGSNSSGDDTSFGAMVRKEFAKELGQSVANASNRTLTPAELAKEQTQGLIVQCER
jgi:hypothetical protein